MNKKVYIGAVLLASLSFQTMAQTQEEVSTEEPKSNTDKKKRDNLSNQEVIIVKDFEPTISDAHKVTAEPKKTQVYIPKLNFNYEVVPKFYNTDFFPDSIKAARIKGEPLNKLYRGYAEGGLGIFNTAYAKLHLNNLRSRNKFYGLKLQHFSTNGGIQDAPRSAYNEQNVSLYGRKFLQAHAIGGEIFYDRNRVHLYGFDPNIFPTETFKSEDIKDDQIKRVYQTAGAKAKLQSFYADSNVLNYNVNVGYEYFWDDTTNKENRLLVNGTLERYFGSEQTLLNFDVDFNKRTNDSIASTSGLIVNLNPQVVARGKKWRLSAGLIATIENNNDTKFRFYPNAHFKYNVFGDLVIPYIGLTGGLTRVNQNSLTSLNPYVSPFAKLENQNKRIEFYGGVRGMYSNTISFNIKASRQQIANQAFFVNASNFHGFYDKNRPLQSEFYVIYDTMNVTHISGEIGYLKQQKINLIAKADFFNYDPNNEAEAWHLPSFKATITGRYDLRDKLVFTADLFYVSKRYAKSLNPLDGEQVALGVYARELKGYVDANLSAQYRYNKKWSLFLKLNNIAAQKFETWNHYENQPFNLLLGATYGFWGK